MSCYKALLHYMLYLEKDTENMVVLRLWEAVTIEDPVYVFQLTNDSTRDIVTFISQDMSGDVTSYNLFSITEAATGVDPYAGIVTLRPSGQWSAKIFESETASLDPEDWGALLKVSIVVVAGEDVAVDSIYR